MKKWIDVDFDVGDMVSLKTDKDEYERLVFGIQVLNAGNIIYGLCQGTTVSWHYSFEMTKLNITK